MFDEGNDQGECKTLCSTSGGYIVELWPNKAQC